MLTPASRFTEHLMSLGIPIDGVSGEGPACRIDQPAEATAEQREAARAAARTFDWLPNFERKDAADILPSVDGLTPAQRQMVLNRMIARHLAEHPALARTVGINPYKVI